MSAMWDYFVLHVYVGTLRMSAIWGRGVSATREFLMYCMNGNSIRTEVIVRYRAGVCNSGVSAERGSTV